MGNRDTINISIGNYSRNIIINNVYGCDDDWVSGEQVVDDNIEDIMDAMQDAFLSRVEYLVTDPDYMEEVRQGRKELYEQAQLDAHRGK